MMNMLNAFDEYPVENFHSLLRAQTFDHDNGDTLCKKAKGLDAKSDVSMSFESTFVIPKNYTFGHKNIDQLKIMAAKFLIDTFQDIKDNLNNATQITRPKRKKRNLTYWKLPQLYGDESIVTSKILPLGYQFLGKEPNPSKFLHIIDLS